MREDAGFRIEDVGYIVSWHDNTFDKGVGFTLVRDLIDLKEERTLWGTQIGPNIDYLSRGIPKIGLIPDFKKKMRGKPQSWAMFMGALPKVNELSYRELDMAYRHYEMEIPKLFSEREREMMILPIFCGRTL